MSDQLAQAKQYLETLQSPKTTQSNPTLATIIETVMCVQSELATLSKDDDNELAVEIKNIISATQEAAIRLCFATAFNNIRSFQVPRIYNYDDGVANLAKEIRRLIEERGLDIDKAANGNPRSIFGPNYLSLVESCTNALAADLKSAITNAYLLRAESLLQGLNNRLKEHQQSAPLAYDMLVDFSKMINETLVQLDSEIPPYSPNVKLRQDKITSHLAEITVGTCLAVVEKKLSDLTNSEKISDFLNHAPHILNKAAGSVTGLRSPEEQATALESISKLRSSLKPAVINACLTISERILSDLENAPKTYQKAKKDYKVFSVTDCLKEIRSLFLIAKDIDLQHDPESQAKIDQMIQLNECLDPAIIRACLANAKALVEKFKEHEVVPGGCTFVELTNIFRKVTLNPDKIPGPKRLSEARSAAKVFENSCYEHIRQYFSMASEALQRMAAEQQLPPPARFGRRSPS